MSATHKHRENMIYVCVCVYKHLSVSDKDLKYIKQSNMTGIFTLSQIMLNEKTIVVIYFVYKGSKDLNHLIRHVFSPFFLRFRESHETMD